MKQSTPDEFLKSVYLGDRACKAIGIDCWQKELYIEVNQISRIRRPDGVWNFYSDEDIVNGRVVFTGVESISLTPSGPLPNDAINGIDVQRASSQVGDAAWIFLVSINSVSEDGTNTEVVLRIIGVDVHLEDPLREGAKIRD